MNTFPKNPCDEWCGGNAEFPHPCLKFRKDDSDCHNHLTPQNANCLRRLVLADQARKHEDEQPWENEE